MNILIIGATGSIGKAVTHKLVNEYNVNLTLFSRKATTLPKLDNVSRINGDVMNYNDLKFAMNNIDTVFIALIGDLPAMIKNIVRVVIDTSVKKNSFYCFNGNI
ncbi:NAD(P)H-binding protein [Apilactobacillus ozensis]|uniref:NAD(P)H-binding protein n=1 Tax=Apilactobacillus ozensis TaxID=866801 RepID=UPI002092B8B8|nr:NAD(P)H-binding protein [Apilactobacillus ozensis]